MADHFEIGKSAPQNVTKNRCIFGIKTPAAGGKAVKGIGRYHRNATLFWGKNLVRKGGGTLVHRKPKFGSVPNEKTETLDRE